MEKQVLKARLRSDAEQGTRACRKLRRNGEIPANLYGSEKAEGKKTTLSNAAIAISAYEMMQLISHSVNVVEVHFEGKKELAQIKEVQRDTFGEDVLHVDMEMIDATQKIHLEVELVFKGDSKGVKEGGRMQIDLHELEIECLPLSVPENIIVRVDDLGMNEALHVSDLTLPEGVVALSPPEQSVVQVVPAEVEEEPEEGEGDEAAEGGAEPEVISKGKAEGEGE